MHRWTQGWVYGLHTKCGMISWSKHFFFLIIPALYNKWLGNLPCVKPRLCDRRRFLYHRNLGYRPPNVNQLRFEMHFWGEEFILWNVVCRLKRLNQEVNFGTCLLREAVQTKFDPRCFLCCSCNVTLPPLRDTLAKRVTGKNKYMTVMTAEAQYLETRWSGNKSCSIFTFKNPFMFYFWGTYIWIGRRIIVWIGVHNPDGNIHERVIQQNDLYKESYSRSVTSGKI